MRKVCKKCKSFVEEDKCQICGSNQFSENWKGRVYIINPENSAIAKTLKITKPGTYAIKSK